MRRDPPCHASPGSPSAGVPPLFVDSISLLSAFPCELCHLPDGLVVPSTTHRCWPLSFALPAFVASELCRTSCCGLVFAETRCPFLRSCLVLLALGLPSNLGHPGLQSDNVFWLALSVCDSERTPNSSAVFADGFQAGGVDARQDAVNTWQKPVTNTKQEQNIRRNTRSRDQQLHGHKPQKGRRKREAQTKNG